MKPLVDPSRLFYGMNIHPQYEDSPWFKSPAEVIEEVHELGCTVARIDCYGLEEDANLVLEHVRAAEGKDILILPCFAYNHPFEHRNHESGFYVGSTTARILRDHCPIYEVTNEISVYCNGEGAGTDPARYDLARFRVCRELIIGVIEGIKSEQPDAKIVIGGGVTTLTAFNDMLWNGTEPDGSSGHPQVRWDYTGWHWYESSGRIDAACDGTDTPCNVIGELSRYGVPIWITELGFVPDNANLERQSAYVAAGLAEYQEYRQRYDLVGACWYALYDDGSGQFGLIQVTDDARALAAPEAEGSAGGDDQGGRRAHARRKPAHETYKAFVSMNPDDGDGEGGGDDEFHTAEYRLPMALYRNLVAAADAQGVSENDELVRRLESTFG